MTGVVQSTGRWRGLAGGALVAGAIGAFARQPALLFVSAMGVALAAYARGVPAPRASVAISRSVDDSSPDPGDEVEVEVRVRNTGARTLPQLVVADHAPSSLSVVDGSKRTATALRPGAVATMTYVVETSPGIHEFGDATVVMRDPVGLAERTRTVKVQGADAVSTRPRRDDIAPALVPETARFAGRHATDQRGDGLSFRSVREYRRGDPIGRVDWKQYARTGDLATVEFHEDRRASVVLAVDTRPVSRLAPRPNAPTARQRAFEGATTLYDAFADAGHCVGVARFGSDPAWLSPGRGPVHERRAREHLTVPGGDAASADRDWSVWLRERVPSDAVVVIFTPACDDDAVTAIRRLRASVPVRVVSPDSSGDDTAGHRLARLERDRRLRALRAARVSVLDWAPETDLGRIIATQGWET